MFLVQFGTLLCKISRSYQGLHMPVTTVEPPDLYSLVYTSTASRPLAKSDLEGILTNARRKNLEEHVTGLLLFTEGKFMQYFEGPKTGVLKIFELICKSSLHEQIVEVSRQSLASREYGDWSMAFLADVDPQSLPQTREDASLRRNLEAQTSVDSTTAHTQLAEFWKKP
jgi:hypothetical protein